MFSDALAGIKVFLDACDRLTRFVVKRDDNSARQRLIYFCVLVDSLHSQCGRLISRIKLLEEKRSNWHDSDIEDIRKQLRSIVNTHHEVAQHFYPYEDEWEDAEKQAVTTAMGLYVDQLNDSGYKAVSGSLHFFLNSGLRDSVKNAKIPEIFGEASFAVFLDAHETHEQVVAKLREFVAENFDVLEVFEVSQLLATNREDPYYLKY